MPSHYFNSFTPLSVLTAVGCFTALFSEGNCFQSEALQCDMAATIAPRHGLKQLFPNSLIILPQDGRVVFYEAFAAAKRTIKIEICVLEDPEILKSLRRAIKRGVDVRVIVDRSKYESLSEERKNLAHYVTKWGGKLHLSNPIFPRSFPKVIAIDDRYALIGTACLDTTTFDQYRDYVYVSDSSAIIAYMLELFINDWKCSAKPGDQSRPFNPTPAISLPNIIISPVNAAAELISLLQRSVKTLDVTSELLGNEALESELFAAVARGVHVRLIAPKIVNAATLEEQALQHASLKKLKRAGVKVHTTQPPETAERPYMHARTAIVDGRIAYIGSISLSPNSSTFNREVGLILKEKSVLKKLRRQFEIDFHHNSQ